MERWGQSHRHRAAGAPTVYCSKQVTNKSHSVPLRGYTVTGENTRLSLLQESCQEYLWAAGTILAQGNLQSVTIKASEIQTQANKDTIEYWSTLTYPYPSSPLTQPYSYSHTGFPPRLLFMCHFGWVLFWGSVLLCAIHIHGVYYFLYYVLYTMFLLN